MKNKAEKVTATPSGFSLFTLAGKFAFLYSRYRCRLFFFIMIAGILLISSSCKTCKCPAYTSTDSINQYVYEIKHQLLPYLLPGTLPLLSLFAKRGTIVTQSQSG